MVNGCAENQITTLIKVHAGIVARGFRVAPNLKVEKNPLYFFSNTAIFAAL
jgi:hypothetical protein